MSSALDLVVLNGPLEGEAVQLRPNVRLLLGRSAKGLQLIDPLVSLNHAEITWEGDRFWIQDLGSATGTYVNEVRLAEKAYVLVPGMRIRLGETDVEVRERPRSALLRIVGAFAALFILFLGVRAVMESIEVQYEPAVRWFEPIQQGVGYASPVLDIPRSFIREAGVDHRELRIEQVTDYDANGVSELWLKWPGGRRLVTFNPDGTWRTLAELHEDCRPKGTPVGTNVPAPCIDPSKLASEVPEVCADLDTTPVFPDLDCAGSIWRYADGGYRIVQHDGVYAWMPPTRTVKIKAQPKKKGGHGGPSGPTEETVVVDGPPTPFVFAMRKETDNLAGFLAERGVGEPIHYLICEEALPGIRAQVLTSSGEVVPLSVGCIGEVSVEGPTRTLDFGDGSPRMFAFTGHGYEALLDDVAVYLSGGTRRDRLFMTQDQRKAYEAISATPSRRMGLMVVFKGPERIFQPIAEESPLPTGERTLVASEFSAPPPPRVRTVLIDGPGRYELEGCGELDVQANDWHCLFTKGCGAQSTFLRLQNIGCGGPGPLAEVQYGRGVYQYKDATYEGRVAVESLQQSRQIDVLRVRFAYRSRME